MKTKIIIWAVCLSCLYTPAYSTGLLEAKIKAAAGVAKGAALLGAGALAAKGALLKGAGSLLASKGAAIKGAVLAAGAKPVRFAPPTIAVEKPVVIPSKPYLVPVPAVPVVSAEVPVLTPSVTTLLSNRLNGLLNTVETTIYNKIPAVHVKTIKSPIVYEIVRTPKIYPVPC